jgi:hypothetical protein
MKQVEPRSRSTCTRCSSPTKKKRNVNVTLGPTLKFQEVEAGLGNVGFGLQYVVLEPVISAAGVGETEPSWDYQAAPGMDLTGSKWMHLLVKAPKEMETGAARLDLAADLVKDRFRIPLVARPKPTMADPLTVRLWGA